MAYIWLQTMTLIVITWLTDFSTLKVDQNIADKDSIPKQDKE